MREIKEKNKKKKSALDKKRHYDVTKYFKISRSIGYVLCTVRNISAYLCFQQLTHFDFFRPLGLLEEGRIPGRFSALH